MGANSTSRSTSAGCAPANRPAGIEPHECEISDIFSMSLMAKDEPDRRFQLLRGILGNTQRRMVRRGPVHLRIAIGMAEAIEVEAPHVEARVTQRVAP